MYNELKIDPDSRDILIAAYGEIANMKKWEYYFYNRRGAPWHEMLKELNALGERGWEMVSSDVDIRDEGEEKVLYYHAVLKRLVSA